MVAGCTTTRRQGVVAEPYLPASVEPRIANLERAARLPWVDEGACAVREAAGEWKTLVERCFYALDHSRIQFRDVEGRCPVANADAATVQGMVGICLLVQPELAVAAVIIVGAVIIGAAIAAELATVKKPGCYCYCLKPGAGKSPMGRLADAGACRALCQSERAYGAQGYNCGEVTEWFVPKLSLR
jgi:hypothetical protein